VVDADGDNFSIPRDVEFLMKATLGSRLYTIRRGAPGTAA